MQSHESRCPGASISIQDTTGTEIPHSYAVSDVRVTGDAGREPLWLVLFLYGVIGAMTKPVGQKPMLHDTVAAAIEMCDIGLSFYARNGDPYELCFRNLPGPNLVAIG